MPDKLARRTVRIWFGKDGLRVNGPEDAVTMQEMELDAGGAVVAERNYRLPSGRAEEPEVRET